MQLGTVYRAGGYSWDLSHHLPPRNLENVEAGWGQVLVPRVLALLTWLTAEVRWALPWVGRWL